jgi:hypothetical protein
MLSNWGSGRVEKRRLTEKNKRPVGGESSLRFDNLCERASEVDGGGSRAFTSSPGNRSTQRVIDLEGARTVTETLQPPAIVGRKLRGCDAKQLSGSHISENEVSFWELCNFMTGFNPTAKIFQITGEGIRESLSATTQNRPTARVTGS